MDDKSDATNNESGATNKSHATTCYGSGSNEIGATNKYGANNNKSGATCCCGSVSIERGTKVVAIVLGVQYMFSGINWLFGLFYLQDIWVGLACIVVVGPCLLVIYAQKEGNPWLFVPYLILGVVVELMIRGFTIYKFCDPETLMALIIAARNKSGVRNPMVEEFFLRNGCTFGVITALVTIPLSVWLYSIIFRGFLAVKEAESRRSRPPV
ncbi:hypothetical protein GPALN_003169 [Globodera pallida]|nr:hypothetical protein GPALN_003169 [Globodera pallida]